MGVCLVTGATAGIGHEFARQLAVAGHDLVLVARDADRLDTVRRALEASHGIQVEVLAADLADRAQLEQVAERARATERPIEILVNNAGFGLKTDLLDTPIEDEERLLDVLCRATLVLSHAAGGVMVERGQGRIINVSSVAGFIATGTYSAAKAWTTVFTEALAGQLAGTGVTATALCPGFTRTEFHARADIEMSGLPSFLWLEVEGLVRQALADAGRGKVISTPGVAYQAARIATSIVPRALLRSGGPATRSRLARQSHD
jgi:short-subunit dehydrogenase